MNPFAGVDIGWLWYYPLAAVVLLAIVLGFVDRRALVKALVACGIFIGILAVTGMGEMGNAAAGLFIAGLVFSPWICCLVFAAFTAHALWRSSKKPLAAVPESR